MRILADGLKNNWKAFSEIIKTNEVNAYGSYYFVIEESDNGDEAFIITSHTELDEKLEELFWERERYNTDNLDKSMSDIKVWKLIPKADVIMYPAINKRAKITKIVDAKNQRYYRKLIPINVERTINISTHSV